MKARNQSSSQTENEIIFHSKINFIENSTIYKYAYNIYKNNIDISET